MRLLVLLLATVCEAVESSDCCQQRAPHCATSRSSSNLKSESNLKAGSKTAHTTKGETVQHTLFWRTKATMPATQRTVRTVREFALSSVRRSECVPFSQNSFACCFGLLRLLGLTSVLKVFAPPEPLSNRHQLHAVRCSGTLSSRIL